MKQKVVRENGYYWDEDTGCQYLWQENSGAAHRRAVYRGEVKTPFWFKLRKVLRALRICRRECFAQFIEFMDYAQHDGYRDMPPEERAFRQQYGLKPGERYLDLG